MSRGNMLMKNTFVYFLGTFGSKLLSFLLLPLYSNYLSQEAYGNFDLINTIITLLYPVLTLMLDNAVYVFLINNDTKYKKEEIVSVVLKVFIFNSMIAIVFAIWYNAIWPTKYIFWIVSWLISLSAYNVWIQVCRGYDNPLIYSITGILLTAITLIGNIVGIVVLKMDYESLLIANTIANSVGTLFLEYKFGILKIIFMPIKIELIKKLLQYSIPLIPNTVSWWIINVSDRLMVTYFIDSAANGVYAMASKIPAILTIIHSIFSMAWTDDILKSDDLLTIETYANKIYNRYITVMIGISAILICSNRMIFQYIIGGNFIESYKYTYFLYLACIFSALSSCLGSFYGFVKKSIIISIGSAAAAAINFVFNLLFIPVLGIQAASISTFLGFLCMLIIRLYGLRGVISISIENKNKIFFLLLIPLFWVSGIEKFSLNIVVISASILLAAFINKDLLIAFWCIFKDKKFKKENY